MTQEIKTREQLLAAIADLQQRDRILRLIQERQTKYQDDLSAEIANLVQIAAQLPTEPQEAPLHDLQAHIDHCVTHCLPIDRAAMAPVTGLSGNELEVAIARAIVDFCQRSQGATGRPSAANEPRNGELKRAAQEGFPT